MSFVKFTVFPCTFYLLYTYCDYWYWSVSWLTQLIAVACVSWTLTRAFVRNFLCKNILDRVDPSNKAILITGCASGFGFDAAIELNRLGYYVLAGCRDTNDSRAKKLAASVKHPQRLKLLKLEVTDADDIKCAHRTVKQLMDDREEGVTQLHALINNAGIAAGRLSEAGDPYDMESFSRHLDVNYLGAVRLTKVMLPFIRQSKGRVIMISSMSARVSQPLMGQYGASKAALAKLACVLRLELQQFDVKVIDIQPAFFKTPMADGHKVAQETMHSFSTSTEEVKKAYASSMVHWSRLLIKGQTDEWFVVPNWKSVIDEMVEAVESYEPDYVCPVASRPIHYITALGNALPWEMITEVERLFSWLMRDQSVDHNQNEINVDKL